MELSITPLYVSECFYRLFLYLIFTCFSGAVCALELVLDEPSPDTPQGIEIKVVNKVYPRATQGSVICGKAHHMTRFRLNVEHAGLSVSLISKEMTRVKIRWDHPEKVLFPFPDEKKIITFPLPGSESRLFLRAYEPVSGNLYVMDEYDVVIKTCPYSFLPVKRYRQGISVSVSETEYDRDNDVLENQNGTVSVKYRISTRTAVPDGGTWSLSVGVSQSDSSTDSQRVHSSFSYNW